MKRITAPILALAFISACSPDRSDEFVQVVEPVISEPVLIEEAAAPAARTQDICPKTGDGIGGTGCPDSDF